EELHAVPGEPREHVVRMALQVAVDLLLEGVVVDGVDLHLDAGVRRELPAGGSKRLDAGAGLVRPERHRAGVEHLLHRLGDSGAGAARVHRRQPARTGRKEPAPGDLFLVDLQLAGRRAFVRHESLLGSLTWVNRLAKANTITQELTRRDLDAFTRSCQAFREYRFV